MAEITVESVLNQIDMLPVNERWRIFESLTTKLRIEKPSADEGRFVELVPLPDPGPSVRWMNEHSRAYEGEWVALDGHRLIAHGADSKSIFAAAKADGAVHPIVTFIPPSDLPFIGI